MGGTTGWLASELCDDPELSYNPAEMGKGPELTPRLSIVHDQGWKVVNYFIEEHGQKWKIATRERV